MLFKLLEFHLRKEIKSAKINHSRLNKHDAQHSKHANRENMFPLQILTRLFWMHFSSTNTQVSGTRGKIMVGRNTKRTDNHHDMFFFFVFISS